PLLGYVVATAKSSKLVQVPIVAPGEDQDPLFAHWRYGLGKAVAFTSDAKNRWGKHWVQWPMFSTIWAQTARWSMRQRATWDYNVQTRIDGSEGRIVVDAVNDKGNFVDFLAIGGAATSPDAKTQKLQLSQTGPGRYEGNFRADSVGTYIINLNENSQQGGGAFRTGISVPYSPEFRQFDTNHSLLKQIAEITNGRTLSPDTGVFKHLPDPIEVSKDLWPLLLLIALCAFPFDVFLRRVMIDYDRLLYLMQKNLAWLPIIGKRWRDLPERSTESMERLLKRKREVRQQAGPAVQPGEFASRLDASASALTDREPAGRSGSTATRQDPKTEPEPEEGGYTQRLLAAKKRALKKKE
ncbi:MAG: hypothetical protein QF886_19775, partial [Planctomycetota bacterium]|nr:hypothetical protein [Planctomycetota bacterium]